MEIGRLTAVFDADHSRFDRGARVVEAKVVGMTGVMKSLGSASVALQGPLGGVAGRLQGLSALSGQAATAAGALGVGLAVVGTAAVGLGIALFKLTTWAAELGGEIFDLSQKINFSAETLSGLKVAAELSGGSLASLSTSLGIFDRNLEEAAEKGSEMSRVFKVLKIDTDDNEKALRQAFAALAKLTSGSQQTAVAMKLFGRSGKEVLGIVKETGGNIDEFIDKMRAMGLVITTDGAKKADEFGDKLTLLRLKLESVARQIGTDLIPVVQKAAADVSAALDSNKAHAWTWADSVVAAMKFAAEQIRTILAGAQSLINDFNWAVSTMKKVPGQQQAADRSSLITTAMGAIVQSQFGSPDVQPYKVLGMLTTKPKGGGKSDPRLDFGKKGGGGGRRGGGGADPAIEAKRMAALQLQAVIEGLEAEMAANRRSLELRRRDFNTYSTQYMAIETRRHAAVINGLDAEEKAAKKLKKGQDVAVQEIANKRIAENTKHEQNRNNVLDQRSLILDRMNKFMADQEKEVSAVTYETDRWQQAIDDLVESLRLEGVTIEGNMMRQMRATAQIGRDIEARKNQIKVIEEGATRLRRAVFATGNETRPRIATDELLTQRAQEQFDKIHEQMMGLGQDLTSIFSRSIGDGFEGGVKRGLKTLAQGLLDIIQNLILGQLAKGLGNLLTDFMAGASGGTPKWLDWVLSIGGAAAGGALGGGGGKGGGIAGTGGKSHASGLSYVPYDNYPAMLHKGERVMTASENRGGGSVINNYTIQLPPSPRGSYSSPKSQRQMAEQLIAALQGS